MRTLRLTTPLMQGNDVKMMQAALKRNNFFHSPVDGFWGPLSAQAAYRAKYYLGYRKPDKVAGELLYKYLSGQKKPSVLMRAFADMRARRKPKVPKRVQLAQKLVGELGTKENPAGSNRVKYSTWYGLIGPWCAMFVTWGGSGLLSAFIRGKYYAYVPYIVADAKAGRNHLTLAHSFLTGVIVCFDWRGDGVADHVGVVVEERHLKEWNPVGLYAAKTRFGSLLAGEFWSIEGNTGIGNDSNGGEVMLRKRNHSLVQVLVNAR